MNIKNKNHLKFHFLSFTVILILSFIVLYPSFNLAFEDEEWQGIVLPKTIYSSYVTSKITSYSSPMWFMTNLYVWLGPNFSIYFILSFILRNLVAFSILVFIYTTTKDRLASFLGGVFMAVTFTGLQNTYEVVNMIAYLSMAGLIIFLIYFFKTFDKFSLMRLIIMGTSLLITTFIASFRVYPVYVWAFIVDSSRVLIHFKKEMIKPFLLRQLVILIIFIFLYKIGVFVWYGLTATEDRVNEVTSFVSDTLTLLITLDGNIIATFLKSLGNIIFPSTLDKSGIISLLLGAALIIIFIGVFIYGMKRRTKNLHLLLSFLFWPLFFYTLYFIIYINRGHRDSPPLPSHMRYLLPPFIGFNIALAIFVSLTRKIKFNSIILASVVILILVHSISTYSFLNKLSKQRDGPFMMKIWQQIPQVVLQSSLSTQKMNVFYFETDGTERAIYTVNDGFIGHAIAVYKIDSKPSKFDSTEISAFGRLLAPPIITYEELLSYIRKSLSENPEPDIWDRIFALRVEGERVIDIKKDVRERVEVSIRK